MPEEIPTAGMWWPAGGWSYSPVPIGTPGVEQWPGFDGQMRFFVAVGSPAWDVYQRERQNMVEFPYFARGDVNLLPGPWGADSFVSVNPATVTTGPTSPPVSEYTNDPALGVVPVGTPTDQSTLAKVVNLPAGWVSKLLGPGSVNATTAQAVRATPFLFWGLIAWFLYRRLKK